jgi:hypothetical protein
VTKELRDGTTRRGSQPVNPATPPGDPVGPGATGDGPTLAGPNDPFGDVLSGLFTPTAPLIFPTGNPDGSAPGAGSGGSQVLGLAALLGVGLAGFLAWRYWKGRET